LLSDFVKALINYYQNMVSDEKGQRRNRLQDIRAAKLAGTLIEADEVAQRVIELATELRGELEGIPAKVTRDLELRKKIESEIIEAFRRHTAKAQKLRPPDGQA
jgi:hypothetical protein